MTSGTMFSLLMAVTGCDSIVNAVELVVRVVKSSTDASFSRRIL